LPPQNGTLPVLMVSKIHLGCPLSNKLGFIKI